MDVDINDVIVKLSNEVAQKVLRIAILECQVDILRQRIDSDSADREVQIKD